MNNPNKELIEKLQVQYDVQKALNADGSSNLVKDFFAAFDALQQADAENEIMKDILQVIKDEAHYSIIFHEQPDDGRMAKIKKLANEALSKINNKGEI